MSVRVRFAPSPTGFLHVGGLRTALYNYLFAKHQGGTFILRIEDTDQSRYVPGATENLIATLQWTGLRYDEGPGIGGPHAPYIQSERTALYQKAAEQLLAQNHAYKCFCTTERLEAMRAAQQAAQKPPKYDKLCASLSSEEVRTKEEAGTPFVIRMQIPENRTITFHDVIRGEISFNTDSVDDQVLIKSDGFPTYHLANVVDDHDMQITHVIRGEEWLSSTPKHILLYEYFGWQHPIFAHLPLLLNADRSKLSKRQGDVAVEDYRRGGYQKEALINFVAFLGWNPGGERELFSLAELEKEFTLDRVGKSGAVFNLEKLRWFNEQHIRMLSTAEIIEQLRPIMLEHNVHVSDEYLAKVIDLMRERVHFLEDFIVYCSYFYKDPEHYDPVVIEKRWHAKTSSYVNALIAALEQVAVFDKPALEATMHQVAAALEVKNSELIHPVRLALSGVGMGPGLYELMEVLGRDVCIRRLKHAVAKLG